MDILATLDIQSLLFLLVPYKHGVGGVGKLLGFLSFQQGCMHICTFVHLFVERAGA